MRPVAISIRRLLTYLLHVTDGYRETASRRDSGPLRASLERGNGQAKEEADVTAKTGDPKRQTA
jgi:hypothetical protein